MAFSSQQFLQSLPGAYASKKFYSLPALEKAGIGHSSKLPVCLRIVLESVLRTWDGSTVTEEDVANVASWQPKAERSKEVPFTVARVLLQDFTGVPLGVDLASMRTAMKAAGHDPAVIEPLVPVDLVVDHSVQVDYAGLPSAFNRNLEKEFERNRQRYEFLKWCQQSFNGFGVIPPGVGICHQVNLEYLANGVLSKDDVLYPDTLVGTDSHTTMINGVGVVGWGVGGIEAEAAMLGQPVYILTPDVIGVNLTGRLAEGVTATDLVLRVTQLLREAKVVGKFVEFHGEGAASLPVPDRATISNMSPEYGATMGFFPFDNKTCDYFLATGRKKEQVELIKAYLTAQGMFGTPLKGECEYTEVIELDLATIEPSIAGPKRPQDRIVLSAAKSTFSKLLKASRNDGGLGAPKKTLDKSFPLPKKEVQEESGGYRDLKDQELRNGDVVIAAITSCTNTSNPSVMLAAGILAKKAVEKGLTIKPTVKASLAPGSRVVSEYLEATGLQPYLDKLGFALVGYGCTTCIGNSGPLHPALEKTITENELVVSSVLSGNRNFEARIHQNIKSNFLMSPPLVVAYALAGSVTIDLTTEPLGKDTDGNDVYLKDIWPTLEEINTLSQKAYDPEVYRRLYGDAANQSEPWNEIEQKNSVVYPWDKTSTYIQEPPYFEKFSMDLSETKDIVNACCLGLFGDSVTTDHISPAGAIKKDSPAGKYLLDNGVAAKDFNSYGSRRGNHEVMIRGTFANVRIRNLIVPGSEGGITIHVPSGEQMSIYDASLRYQKDGESLIVIAGSEYGTGSSRDWAAKGTLLLGVKAVVAKSFERIHRSNLIGMGVLPCQFTETNSGDSLNLTGRERFSITGISDGLTPGKKLTLIISSDDGKRREVSLTARLDTQVEVDYYRNGGILPYVLRDIIRKAV